MPQNIEIKARVPESDFESVRQIASELSDTDPEILVQVDTFFSVPNERLKLREFADGSAELIAYSRSDQSAAKLSSYIRTPVSDPDALKRSLIQTVGLRGVVKKRRELFLVGPTRIHLDEVDGLGKFIELEVVLADDGSREDGVKIADHLSEKLGIARGWLVSCAYIDLLLGNDVLSS